VVDLANLTLRSLCGECITRGFKCGNDDIDTWLWKHALKKHDIFKSRVTTFHESDSMEVIGFYALCVVLEPEKDLVDAFDVRGMGRGGVFPALHLAYLAVREEHQGQGLGRIMMADVLDLFCDMAERASVEVMTLVPLNSEVAAFYTRRKFVAFGKGRALLIDARRAIAERDRAEAA